MTAGTFDLVTPVDVERVSSRRVYQSAREMGAVRRREITPDRELRRWRIRIANGTRGDVYLLRSLWETCRAALDMDWTPPDESAIRVRFTGPPSILHRNGQLKSLECELEEVL